ncbi:MAG: hypothetical protein BWY93_00830 [Euryarchaeota archaeon ADurb.BinA087]|nr:MAG: hypothetical protein BWY93_00830 [Euryarchaeota archaeon ADurb.BinA087]
MAKCRSGLEGNLCLSACIMRAANPKYVYRIVRMCLQYTLSYRIPRPQIGPFLLRTPYLNKERRCRQLSRAMVCDFVGDMVSFRGIFLQIAKHGMHPFRGGNSK